MDFINRGMLFAATLLLCLFPFLIVANALAGRSAATGLARHLGLNKQAAADVGSLFTSSAATSSAVTGTAWVFFILGGIAAATAIQQLYERAFELDSRGTKDMFRRLIWLTVLVGCSALAGWAGPELRGEGGPVLLGILGLVVLTGFWWFTIWFLLARRISWRDLFPSAVATAVFWLGIEAVFSVIFSGMVTSYDKKYGPIGVVFAPDVLADRHRRRDYPGRGGGHRVAGAEPIVPGCPQETAAGPSPPHGGAHPGCLTRVSAGRIRLVVIDLNSHTRPGSAVGPRLGLPNAPFAKPTVLQTAPPALL